MVKRHTFYHSGQAYVFKYNKIGYVIDQIDPKSELKHRLKEFFTFILSNNFPHALFNDPNGIRCSSFRMKYFKRGFVPSLSTKLIQKGLVTEYKLNQKSIVESNLPDCVKNLPQYTTEHYFEFLQKGMVKPNHDQVLTKILLSSDEALSIETPIWKKKQTTLTDFIKPKKTGKFTLQFNHSYSVTGHIDLILYDNDTKTLVISDYKPEGKFLTSLPQVATYGLIIKKILDIDSIMCASFNKDYVWYYNPTIIQNEIEKEIISVESRGGLSKKLNWRKIVKKI